MAVINGTNGTSSINGSKANATPILRVGIIGCGEISQVAHIPNINHMSHKFAITYLCDVSEQALQHCASKVAGAAPRTTTDAEQLCASDQVDVVIVANATAFHVSHALLALKYDKYCLLEKPAALNYRDIDRLIEAEASSKARVLVGYMRRYASAFLEAVQEVGGLSKIQYARVRDIIGPNSDFVSQSGTFPKRFADVHQADIDELTRRDEDMVQQALRQEFGVQVTPSSKLMLQLLGGLGSHDLSAMRETLGMPTSCVGASLGPPGIWTALFQYDGFPVTYESGINNIPVFDACIEIFSADKSVKVTYDTPYIKGLPVTLTIREKVQGRPGSASASHGFQERVIRRTYEDAYVLELDAFYQCVVEGGIPKTSVADAREDVDLFAMILRAGENNYNKV